MKFSIPALFSLSHLALQVSAINGYDEINREVESHLSSDLHIYESRPDLRPPKFEIRSKDATAQASNGYYFVAPYVDLIQRPTSRMYSPLQNGPHIYDNAGNLVWSGAALFPDRPVFDFRVVEVDGKQAMSMIIAENEHEKNLTSGAGIILDSSYNMQKVVKTYGGRGTANMHEFRLVDGGKQALVITYESTLRELSHDAGSFWLGNNGFQDIDVETGKVLFEWWALDHVDAFYSQVPKPTSLGAYHRSWDFFHANSVDKDAEGNYLVSARFMNAVYKINGKDGSIIWQLGGPKSSFQIQGFNFSSQHDARFLEDNSTTTIISIFNNHSNGSKATALVSSAIVVALDKETMTATLVHEYLRPDGTLTHLRGNAQRVPEKNNNMVVCWSENAYMSEHSEDGQLLLEAQLTSKRYQNYRGYKFSNFVGMPAEPPALVAKAYGSSPQQSVTMLYVSWNGATEVDSWNFYKVDCDGLNRLKIGSAKRTGFETSFANTGFASRVVAEAIDIHGKVLHTSDIAESTVPSFWEEKEKATCSPSIPQYTIPLTPQPVTPSAPEPKKGAEELQTQVRTTVQMRFRETVAYVSSQHPYRNLFIVLGCIVVISAFITIRRRRAGKLNQRIKSGLLYV